MPTCTQCGVETEAAFCTECGTPTNGGVPQQPVTNVSDAAPHAAFLLPPKKAKSKTASIVLWALTVVIADVSALLVFTQNSAVTRAVADEAKSQAAIATAESALATAMSDYVSAAASASRCYISWYCSPTRYSLDLATRDSYQSLMNDAQDALNTAYDNLDAAKRKTTSLKSTYQSTLVAGSVATIAGVLVSVIVTVRSRRTAQSS